jgi:hypothetical protein
VPAAGRISMMGISINIYGVCSNVVKIGQKYRVFYMRT